MSPNSISSGFGEIFFSSSSESSDSESLFQEDINKNGNQITQQWEAIERTLYQEPGQHVTDPELLKECKLWRDTFPHIRVKGTKIDIMQPERKSEETDRSIQTVKNHFDLKKLEEKRENIKHRVVGMLVERLIAKYGPEKYSANAEVDNCKSGVQITEIINGDSEEKLEKLPDKPANTAVVIGTDRESYFERGKQWKIPQEDIKTAQQTDNNFCGVFNSSEKEYTLAMSKPRDFKISGKPTGEMSCSKGRLKPRTSTPFVKPFEMTKKIDKKYQGLLERILERKSTDVETKQNCRKSASGSEMRNFQESFERLRIGPGFDDYSRRNTMPRINKFDNNWLKRSETNLGDDNFSFKKAYDNNNSKKLNISKGHIQENRFLQDLEREMALNYKRTTKRGRMFEDISFRRSEPLKLAGENSPKLLSCGDLKKNSKKEAKGSKTLKSGPETGKNEPNTKKRSVKNNYLTKNKGSKVNGTQNPLLPPIETGIICTELTGRSKIGVKSSSKKY